MKKTKWISIHVKLPKGKSRTFLFFFTLKKKHTQKKKKKKKNTKKTTTKQQQQNTHTQNKQTKKQTNKKAGIEFKNAFDLKLILILPFLPRVSTILNTHY